MDKTVLILDDDMGLAKALGSEFKDHGYSVTLAQNLSAIPEVSFDFAVLDVRLVGEFGLAAIETLKQKNPQISIVVLSGYGSVAAAVEAVKRGAMNYLVKPASFAQIEAALTGLPMPVNLNLKPPSLSQIEHEYIDHVLIKNEGNISQSAKDLGIHRQSLQRKLKKYS